MPGSFLQQDVLSPFVVFSWLAERTFGKWKSFELASTKSFL